MIILLDFSSIRKELVSTHVDDTLVFVVDQGGDTLSTFGNKCLDNIWKWGITVEYEFQS